MALVSSRRQNRPPKLAPIIVEQRGNNQPMGNFRQTNATPSINSGVYTPTFGTRIVDRTWAAVKKKKPPTMVQSESSKKAVTKRRSSSSERKKAIRHGLLKKQIFAKNRLASRRHNSMKRGHEKISAPLPGSVTLPPGNYSDIKPVASATADNVGPNNVGAHVNSTTEPRSQSPTKSPVMLVRRRSSVRNLRGNPIKRFFQRLYRRRSRAKFFFTKKQLRRQLSFDVVHSPDRISTYRVKSIELFKLRPAPKRVEPPHKETAPITAEPPVVVSPQPTRALAYPNTLLGSRNNRFVGSKRESLLPRVPESPFSPEVEFDGFEYDYRKPRIPSVQSQRDQPDNSESLPASCVPENSNVQVNVENAAAAASAGVQIPKRSSLRRKSHTSNSNSRGSNNLANHSISSTLPIIRRIDLYDLENPAEALGSSEPKITGKESKFDNPRDVEEALEFVGTWSKYLRRAIAVRVVLRQEIQCWEQKEEEDYNRNSSSSYDSDSLYSNSSESSTTTIGSSSNDSDIYSSSKTTSSVASVNRARPGYFNGLQQNYTSSMISKTSSHDDLSSKKQHQEQPVYNSSPSNYSENSSGWQTYSDKDSSSYLTDRGATLKYKGSDSDYSAESYNLADANTDSHDGNSESSLSYSTSVLGKNIRGNSVYLESMPKRYSTLIDARQTEPGALRTSSDSLVSLSKPDTESVWMSRRSKFRSVSRPLPPLPSKDKRSGSLSSTEKDDNMDEDKHSSSFSSLTEGPVLHTNSEEILKDKYKNFDEPEEKSTYSINVTELPSPSSAELKRGARNRRRPRSETIAKRGNIDTAWEINDSDETSINSDGHLTKISPTRNLPGAVVA